VRIGFISGDIVEVSNERKGVSVPDYPVQGYLMDRWLERGHEVVLLTRHPKPDTAPEGITYDPGGDTNSHDLDVLFGDRLGPFGSEWDENTLHQLEEYRGPIVFHQYVPYSGWAPPFREMRHLMGSQRRWTIVNRSPSVREAYHVLAGHREAVNDTVGAVRWEQWEPWLMLDYPWLGEHVTPDLVGPRQHLQGYYGRVPQGEKRAQSVVRWMSVGSWSRVAYGPETSTRFVARMTGASDGGRIMHRDLPTALTTFNVIVQAPIDRLAGKGQLRFWPHRIVECALAGVLQLFDPGIGIPEFERWRVSSAPELLAWIRELRANAEFLRQQVWAQQEIILSRADPGACLDRLDGILAGAAA
jgi:hypothetical protein